MSQPSPEPSPPPRWAHCGEDASPERPFGCPGIHVPGHTLCLAHLADPDRDAYLVGLTPGADVDHRGTPFTRPLLDALLNAVRDPTTGHSHLGTALFESATFSGRAGFESVTFTGDAEFESVTFTGEAWFEGATFSGRAGFGSVTFTGEAWFERVTFRGNAWFEWATFTRDAGFASATFTGNAEFRSATFTGNAWFEWATFTGNAWFKSATFKRVAWFKSATFRRDAWFKSATFADDAEFGRATFTGDAGFDSVTFIGDAMFVSVTFAGSTQFESATFRRDAWFKSATFADDAWFERATFTGDAGFDSVTFIGDAMFESANFAEAAALGPFLCSGRVLLSGATFGGPVILSFAARRLECRRTRWSATAEIRLRYATVDFTHAVFEYPLTIAAEPDPFMLANGQHLAETALASAPGSGVRLASLRGVDAAHLVLADIDLSKCLFTGTVHLDQLRLEGACIFETTPHTMHWRGWHPMWFTHRRTLVEEHYWRARQPAAAPGWQAAPSGASHVGPVQLAPVYRALRKAFEDGKHEPGAADFYYGEMEMRRHADDIPRSERSLLVAYWALSGYGLRASRALGWLAAAMLVTILLLMGFGLPDNAPQQEATGTVPSGGGSVTFEIDKDDPRNPTGQRFTGERFEKALNLTLNSVVFRSSGQDLTTAGIYIEMTSRLTEPVLLGLAVLAVRNRVKR
ncbi:pentapeptide repeat-containing protein [Streptomyces altiplanensis]